MIQIGEGRIAEFELLVTKWANNDPMYIFCEAQLCDSAIKTCKTASDCSTNRRGKRRAIAYTLDSYADIGEFYSPKIDTIFNGPIYPTILNNLKFNDAVSSSSIKEP